MVIFPYYSMQCIICSWKSIIKYNQTSCLNGNASYFIQSVPGSYLGHNTDYSDRFFMVFPSPLRQQLE
jgi:hypothetical protein